MPRSELPALDLADSGPLVKGFTFWEALYSVNTEPLAEWLRDPAARTQISEQQWLALAWHIESLSKQPPGNPSNPPRDIEVRAAAQRVDNAKRRWRRQNGRKQVPPDVTNRFIADAIKWIAEKRGGVVIPPHGGVYANLERRIRVALKARHFPT
jgi:hypothetical protein